ncbi:hypothetical protein Tco_1400665 [Tanacetum coccineum]
MSLGLFMWYEVWFLSQKRSGGGRGVKEKQVSVADKSDEVSKHANKALGSNSGTQIPKVVNVGLESFLTISEAQGIHSLASANEGPTPASNNPSMSTSYANVTGEPHRKALNFHTLFTPEGNGIVVVVSKESIRAISERFAYTAYGFFLGKRVAYPVVANYVWNT